MFDELVEKIARADEVIRPTVRETPVEESLVLSEMMGAQAWLKLENYQVTGSFKIRGALNKLQSSSDAMGFIAASSGNHGMGVAFGARARGLQATVFVPEVASPAKIETIRSYGSDVKVVGADCVQTEAEARAFGEENDLVYVSPYNDIEVVAGQGTIGRELCRQMNRLDAVFISMGGGGLISGVGAQLKSHFPDVEVVACSPENSCVMHQSLDAGQVLDLPSLDTLSDGTAGGVEQGTITFDYCREVIDSKVLVTEQEIRDAMRLVIDKHHMMLEGSAAVAVAAMLRERERMKGRHVVALLCGANVSTDVLRDVLS